MVFLLFVITVIVFLAIDYYLHKEERAIKETEEAMRSPIFLSPEKSLKFLKPDSNRLYHLSHTWLQPYDQDFYYVGYDSFISSIFSSDIKVINLPKSGAYVEQGNKAWDISSANHSITQLSPVSGNVVEVNPACNMNLSLPADQVEKSWILKIKADPYKNEKHNLMHTHQLKLMNSVLMDELVLSAQKGNYLNDGGKIDPAYLNKLTDEEWNRLVQRFFPYMDKER